MSVEQAIDLAREAAVVALLVSSPIVLAGMLVGLVVSILQAVTQVHEQTLSFVPKLIAMVVATVVTLPLGVASVPDWTGETLAKGLGIAVLSSVLPYSLELLALRRLSAKVFGILLSLEPACAALAGLLVLGQRLAPVQLAGMGLVVAASALVLGLGARKDPAESAAT